jgi:hypothetical protein
MRIPMSAAQLSWVCSKYITWTSPPFAMRVSQAGTLCAWPVTAGLGDQCPGGIRQLSGTPLPAGMLETLQDMIVREKDPQAVANCMSVLQQVCFLPSHL